MTLRKEGLLFFASVVVANEETGLVLAIEEGGAFLAVVRVAREGGAFERVAAEVVGPAATVFERELKFDPFLADGREGIFVAKEKDVLAVGVGGKVGFALEEGRVVGDAHRVEEGGEDIGVGAKARVLAGAKESGLVEEQGDMEVFIEAVAGVRPVAGVLAEGFAVVACKDEDRAFHPPGFFEVIDDLLDLRIEQVEVIQVAFLGTLDIWDHPVLWAVVGVRKVRNKAKVARPERLFGFFEPSQEEVGSLDFVAR